MATLARHEELERWLRVFRESRADERGFGAGTVRLHLKRGAPLAAYDLVHLDNLLAWAVVQEATRGRGVGNPPEGFDGWRIVLPLDCAWFSPCPREEGELRSSLRLWASSVFWPVPSEGTGAVGDTLYWHKRMPRGIHSRPDGRAARLTMNGSTGRWMERRQPVPVTLCDTWEARFVGWLPEVARLLSSVSFVGKRRSVGMGEVARWEVVPEELAGTPPGLWALERDGVLQRPVPEEAARALGIAAEEAPRLLGWTPPQWSPRLWGMGWPAGTKVRIG